jgi:hypothetical protein
MCKRTSVAIKKAQRGIFNQGTTEAFSRKLGVNSAHVYKLLELGKLSPTLDAAMVKAGYLEPLPTRTRLAIDCTADTRQRFRDEAARRGMSGEAYLLYMMEVGG